MQDVRREDSPGTRPTSRFPEHSAPAEGVKNRGSGAHPAWIRGWIRSISISIGLGLGSIGLASLAAAAPPAFLAFESGPVRPLSKGT